MNKIISSWWGSKVNKRLRAVILYCGKKNNALDIGSGLGANSKYLSGLGFNVTAIETDKDLIKKFKLDLKEKNLLHKVDIINDNIENVFFIKKFDLIIALSVLHFLKLEDVKILFDKLRKSLAPGGIIYMRVFSNKDVAFRDLVARGFQSAPNEICSAKLKKHVHYFDKQELINLFKGLEIIEMREEKTKDSHPPEGEHTHFYFNIIARNK
jgi:2-polyprenyl-3-methyl-5-hydroxy-6-metoxy-1,4-benzoquinol methylase